MINSSTLSYSLILLFLSNICSAQILPGSKQVAVSHSGIALANDVFSLYLNPAGLAQLRWRELGAYYSPSPFGMSELSNAFAAYSEPFSFGTIGFGIMTYGFELYRENMISIAFSKRLERILYGGVTFSYKSISIDNYGNSKTFIVNLGGLVYITKYLRTGFAFDNISRATYGGYKDQIPSTLSFGLSYDFLDNLIMNTALIKEIDRSEVYSFGIDYQPVEFINIRSGFKNEPASFSFGVSINYSLFEFEYAGFNHHDLGLTHQFGVILVFNEGKSRNLAIKESFISN